MALPVFLTETVIILLFLSWIKIRSCPWPAFREFADYKLVKKWLEKAEAPELVYEKTNGLWLRFRILKLKKYTYGDKETLWIFEEINKETI